MKDKVAEMVWNETKWREYQLYRDYMLMGAFISLIDEVVFDVCNDNKLVYAIDELQDYLEGMIKKEIDKYHHYDAKYRNLPQHKKVKYEVLAQNILDFIESVDKHPNCRCTLNNDDGSWGGFYYGWNEQ